MPGKISELVDTIALELEDKIEVTKNPASTPVSEFTTFQEIMNLISIPQKQFIPLSTTIGDYDQTIDRAIASSPETTVLQNSTNSENFLRIGQTSRMGQKFIAGAAVVGKVVTQASFWLSKTGSPSGTFSIVIRNSADTLVHTFLTISTSVLTTTPTKFTGSAGEYLIAAGDRILVEVSAGTTGNTVDIEFQSTDVYDTTKSYIVTYDGSYSDVTGQDMRFELKYVGGQEAIDGVIGTKWTSDSEIGPQIVLDIGSLQEIAAIALYRDTADTTTQITIELSPDDITYTLFRTINTSLLGSGAYKFVLPNRALEKMQYIRIKGTDGTAKVMSFAEIAIRSRTESQANREHEHKTIDPTDATLQPNGDP